MTEALVALPLGYRFHNLGIIVLMVEAGVGASAEDAKGNPRRAQL